MENANLNKNYIPSSCGELGITHDHIISCGGRSEYLSLLFKASHNYTTKLSPNIASDEAREVGMLLGPLYKN